MAVPKSYRSIEDFEREELRPSFKIGFSIDDLVQESGGAEEMLFDDTFDEYDPDADDDDGY